MIGQYLVNQYARHKRRQHEQAFALAMQVKPDITYAEFCDIAVNTAVMNSDGLKVINPKGIINALS
ncbi:MAG: hypothetical protein EOM87_05135 [Clostridia bacterium]|nr:hypothetical protein [Clostridia bacterium]